MTVNCKDFVVLIRFDNPLGTGSQWFVLNSYTTASAALACMNEQRTVGKVVKIVRQ